MKKNSKRSKEQAAVKSEINKIHSKLRTLESTKIKK